MSKLRWVAAVLIAVALHGIADIRPSVAQTYPQKPVRVVVPAPAGGPTDVPARLVAEGLGNLVGQRFVVENRVGTGGIIGVELLSRRVPAHHRSLPRGRRSSARNGRAW